MQLLDISLNDDIEASGPKKSKLCIFYLMVYYCFQACAWGLFGSIMGKFALDTSCISICYSYHQPFKHVYHFIGEFMCWWQLFSVLEVIHSAKVISFLGIVPRGLLFPLMQWSERVFLLWAVVRNINEVQSHQSVFMIFTAWSLMEVIKYWDHDRPPYSATSLRYNNFFVLYPVGIAGEVWLMCEALPYIKAKNLYPGLFAWLPFSYYQFVMAIFLCYPFLWLNAYVHLVEEWKSEKQRRKMNRLRARRSLKRKLRSELTSVEIDDL